MKRLSVIILGLFGALFVCGLSAALMLNVRESVYAADASSSSAESFTGGFLLTFHQGFVAVKQIGEATPCRVYEIPEAMLSEYDRKLLSEGVYFVSLEDAVRAAEDFVG